MSRDSKFSRLRSLIDRTIDQYTEPVKLASLTKEKEKDLLMALSQALRKVEVWTCKLDRDSDSDTSSEHSSDMNSCSGPELQHEENNCLTKVLADLLLLMNAESQFVRHLAGNLLEAISKFLAVSVNEWSFFIHSLCTCFGLAIANGKSYALEPSGNDDSSNYDTLKLALKEASWYTVTGIIRILRNTLKYLKQEGDNKLLEVYLHCVSLLLSNLPWDHMDKIHVGQKSDTLESDSLNDSCPNDLFLGHDSEKELKILFLGNLVQFLCSLVEQSGAFESNVDSSGQHPVLCITINAMPKLLSWCLGETANGAKIPVNQYLRHKLLMLMLRISYQTQLHCCTLVSWLQLLHDYFEEILQKSIINLDSNRDESLEGSPFLLGLSSGEVLSMPSLHLQRQAVFLFFRCCFSLISLTEDTSKQCACAPTSNKVTHLASCRKEGCSELYSWLQVHLPIHLFVDHEINAEKYIGFASYFIKLYIHEDDVLFKVLLLMLSIPSFSEQQLQRQKCSFQNVEDNILFHVSNIFNPIHLFHIFLAELHYDHQVLLDYLISNDTGTSCAEYLLRSLRTVCDSWYLFTNFSLDGKDVIHPFCKKRKLLLGASDFQARLSSIPLEKLPSELEDCERYYEHGCNNYKSKTTPFTEAKGCLLSLKDSVENLHRKNLFPYNPKVLLKRLRNFEQLCSRQKDFEH